MRAISVVLVMLMLLGGCQSRSPNATQPVVPVPTGTGASAPPGMSCSPSAVWHCQ
jgi:putative hemolysin